MPHWKELITTDNIGGYLDEDTFVDVRSTMPVTIEGLWFRPMTTCPYLNDEVAFGEPFLFQDTFPHWNWGSCLSNAYALGHSGTKRLGMTTSPTGSPVTYNASTPRIADTRWEPILTDWVMKNAIYNPFSTNDEDSKMEIFSSRCEVIYSSLDTSHSVPYKVDFGLSWGVFDHPFDANTHTAIYNPSNTPDNSNDEMGKTTYTDPVGFSKINIIGMSNLQTTSTHKIIDIDSFALTNNIGYQTNNCRPSSISANANDNIIDKDKALIPLDRKSVV